MMQQPSKILLFILYYILMILTPSFADMSLDNFINGTNDTKLTYDTSNKDTPFQLDSPENIDDLKLVVIINFIMVFFNTIGCSYVFYRSWLQWKISSKSLSMIFRLPFYTAIAGIDIVGILNVTHTAINARVWDQPIMTTYLRVCRQFYFDLGKFDYKLWLVILAITAIFQLIAGPYYGARKYWCAAQANNIIIPIVCFTLISLIFLLVIFCYISILKTLLGHAMEFQIDENNIDEKDVKVKNNNPGSELARTRSRLEKRVSNKIISYVLVFILQWTPVQIFCAAKFFDVSINFGGLGNAIQYILNEGWHPRNVDPNMSWSFAESPSRFIKRFYPNSEIMHAPSSISSLPSSRPPSSSTISKYGATNSVCSDFLNNANNSSNNSVKELNSNPYNIEINIDVNNFVTESEMALSKVKIKEK
ncbi:18874_t:CDS:2 [Gigaspora rosea]|nr:18874_t:CDS:2 [Gigaspora rosea]